ncbi:MAG: aspartate aminotransferase family protein [Planctomycetota bacterium]|nr:aspartate aminotransferase family protein [Planctomycetota bacterium]
MTTQVAARAGSARNSAEINRLGETHLAGGVVSLNRKVDPALVFVRARGCRLWDAEGREYLDYHAAFAPHLLGHNDPGINAAVARAMEDGWSLMGAGTTPWEVELARLLREAVPNLERVQITNTGSEATAHAIRLARAHTGREDLLLTLGGYNGWHNEVARAVMPSLEQVGPRVSPGEYRWLPLSAGIPAASRRSLHLVNFNDLDSVEYVLRRHEVACVLTEPVLQNIGIVKPQPGYLEGLRALCDRYGAVLVFDEVKTGFRSALGGYQSVCGVKPDLSVFGKALANGYPLGAIGGKRELMELFAAAEASKRVLIAGTYNAHPFTCAAAIATLERLMAEHGAVYKQLEARTARLCAGLEETFNARGVKAAVSRNGSAFCAYFMDHEPRDWHDILAHHDFELDRRLRLAVIERGIYQFPMPCKQGSVSAAHGDAEIDRTLEATAEVLKGLVNREQ